MLMNADDFDDDFDGPSSKGRDMLSGRYMLDSPLYRSLQSAPE